MKYLSSGVISSFGFLHCIEQAKSFYLAVKAYLGYVSFVSFWPTNTFYTSRFIIGLNTFVAQILLLSGLS